MCFFFWNLISINAGNLLCKTSKDKRFMSLGRPNRVWSVSSIHGELQKLIKIHDVVAAEIRPGDRIVYHGNYTGYGEESAQCIDELLTFRRLILSKRGMIPRDIIYLRGAQEEIWQKLLQLQFAPNPLDVLIWMLGNGMAGTLQSYGLSPHDGVEACGKGVMALTKWTNTVRASMRRHSGHDIFHTQLLQAAYTDEEAEYPILFVNSGLNARQPLSAQGDTFWWGGYEFESIEQAYRPFEKVVRGYDPAHRGVTMNCVTATIDGGAGFGGPLICAGFERNGHLAAMLEA